MQATPHTINDWSIANLFYYANSRKLQTFFHHPVDSQYSCSHDTFELWFRKYTLTKSSAKKINSVTDVRNYITKFLTFILNQNI